MFVDMTAGVRNAVWPSTGPPRERGDGHERRTVECEGLISGRQPASIASTQVTNSRGPVHLVVAELIRIVPGKVRESVDHVRRTGLCTGLCMLLPPSMRSVIDRPAIDGEDAVRAPVTMATLSAEHFAPSMPQAHQGRDAILVAGQRRRLALEHHTATVHHATPVRRSECDVHPLFDQQQSDRPGGTIRDRSMRNRR